MDIRVKHVLIVAGGNSTRMENPIPKQFQLVAGFPLLYYTFKAFEYIDQAKFTLVLADNYIDYWKNICQESGFNIPHNIVSGGPTRFHSVKAGLKNIPDNELVLIHDSARPFPSVQTINNVIEVGSRKGNAIPVIDIVNSIREVTGNFNRSIDRTQLKAVQTPQGYYSEIIKNAYDQPYNESFKDDANVFESLGNKINTVNGNIENIKITTQQDFATATYLVENYLSS